MGAGRIRLYRRYQRGVSFRRRRLVRQALASGRNVPCCDGVPINPPKCCSLQFGGGLLSFDGLHPSNTGYALVANSFIATIDTGFGATVPQLSPAQIFAIYSTDPYAQH